MTLSGGIQHWTVPYSGQYRIEAVGAAGGYEENQSRPQYRGRGTRMVGTFNLSQGEIIQILVGQEGGIRNCDWSSGGSGGGSGAASGFGVAGDVSSACGGSADSAGGGGGGGTFVVRGSNTSLIVAGGGGGLRAVTPRHEGCDANISTSGNPGYNSFSGGSNGHGAMTADDASSGKSNESRPFLSYLLPLFQNESSCKNFHINETENYLKKE